MKSKALNDAIVAIKSGAADVEIIQDAIPYTELIPYIFNTISSPVQAEKNYFDEKSKEGDKRYEFNEDDFLKMKKAGHLIEVKGVNASPGIAQGKIAYTPKTIMKFKENGVNIVYLLPFQLPENVRFVLQSTAIITTEGGATSHAAVTGRQLGIPTIVGCQAIKFEKQEKKFLIGDHVIKEGDDVFVNGTTGVVYFSKITIPKELPIVVKVDDDDTLKTISDYIYKHIQSQKIYPSGLDLGCLVILLHMNQAKSLNEVAALAIDFEYLSSLKQKSILWKLLLPQLSKLCVQIKELIIQPDDNDRANIKKEIQRTLSRLNEMAIKSVDYRHHMMLLEKTLKYIDHLVYDYKYYKSEYSNYSSPKILLVEDEPYLIAETIYRLKDELNSNLTIISNAQDAIEFIRSTTILDLAIIDLMIPDNNDKVLDFDPYKGIMVSEVIKEVRGDGFPIMYLTSVRDTNILKKLLNSTATRTINKPSLASSIVDTVKDMLRNTNLADAKLLEAEVSRRKLELQSPDPSTRIRSLWALSQYANHDSEINHLVEEKANSDSNEEVRIAAQRILSQPFLLKHERFDNRKDVVSRRDSVSVVIHGNVENSIIILGEENSVQSNTPHKSG
ncbi:Pyruvate, phosphate dikinase [Anaerolineales bacterium]|nr:Pyruvate, phosphate dikinase [Anaerolineales bacterium]